MWDTQQEESQNSSFVFRLLLIIIATYVMDNQYNYIIQPSLLFIPGICQRLNVYLWPMPSSLELYLSKYSIWMVDYSMIKEENTTRVSCALSCVVFIRTGFYNSGLFPYLGIQRIDFHFHKNIGNVDPIFLTLSELFQRNRGYYLSNSVVVSLFLCLLKHV